MGHVLSLTLNYGAAAIGIACAAALLVIMVMAAVPIEHVPPGSVGVRNTGSLDAPEIVAQGEKGVQPQLLPAGTRYFRYNRRISTQPMVVVPNGCIGVVTSHIGEPSIGLTAPYKECFGDFTDVEQFLVYGGQQGVQEAVLPSGTYAIHPEAFEVLVLTADSDGWMFYGREAEVTEALVDAEPYTVKTDASIGLVIEPDSPTLAVRMLARGDHFDRRTAYVVVSPSERIKVEWEVGVPVYDSTDETELVSALGNLAGSAFREAPMSVAEFAAKLDALQAAAGRIHFAQITEAVMRPKLVTTKS